MLIEENRLINLELLSERLKLWFINRNWEIKTDKNKNTYAIMARKNNAMRKFFSACRALVVICGHENGKTMIKVKQGSWAENIWSNVGWFIVTGGTNIIFSLWSFEVQREFQNYVRDVLNEL